VANLQVKNVPEALHRKIRAAARRRGQTVRDLVLQAVRRDMEREEFRARLAQRTPVELGEPVARALAAVRAERAPSAGR
jgi:plasmid stability protein